MVWHSALAVGTMHRKYGDDEPKAPCEIIAEQDDSFARYHHAKAIEHIMGLSSHELPRTLIPTLTACVLFVCFEVRG